jgi:TolA-binding protein
VTVPKQPLRWLLGAVVVGSWLAARGSVVSAQDLAALEQQLNRLEADARNLQRQPLQRRNLRSPTYVEERLTDGELFYRLRDYTRASIIFTDIVENYPNHRAFPDALFLLADSLFRADDLFGARARFQQVIARADEPAFRPYVQRALGRLIEIAIQTRNFDGVEDYFARLNRLPPGEIEAATQYYRGKLAYNRAVPTDDVMREAGGALRLETSAIDQGLLEEARTAFEAVQERSPYYLQSRYFIGVIYTLKGQFPQAIDAFRRVVRAQVTDPDQQAIVELTHLAMGRLYYETDRLDEAIEAYQRVPRTSAYFDAALYEIAWVHIRQGDSTRAERALEVLTVAAPDSRFIPDGKLLRGNLLLRNGRFDVANQAFREIARQFGPVRQQLDDMVARHDDVRAYFRDLVRQNMDAFDPNAFLPPLAQRWARTEGDMDRALSVLADLAECRQLVRETSELIVRLNAILTSPNRISAFPDLAEQRRTSIAIRNRIARIRQQLVATDDTPATGELAGVRAERRRIEALLGRMPVSERDFDARNTRLLERYRELEGELRRMEVELLGIEARVTALERYMADSASRGEQVDESGRQALHTELTQQRAMVAQYRQAIGETRLLIERARVQVGIGDDRYQRDAELREQYARLVARERELLRAQGGGSNNGARIDAALAKATRIEAMLDEKDRLIDEVVDERTAEIKRQVDEETVNVEGYRQRLAALEGESVDVIGTITYLNFGQIRQRFYDLVLRADVGRIDVAWAQREEHRMRTELLTRERTREMRALDDEFREIMDDFGPASESAGGNP